MTLGQDWPTEGLRDVFDAYGLRILGRERRRSWFAPWRRSLSLDVKDGYDPQSTWTETHYVLRRDATCESCGQWFGYSFEVDQISWVHKAGRGTDGALRRELARQLRRRMRCPHCHAVQRDPRRELLCRDRKQSALGCGLVLVGLLSIAGLGALGAWLGGMAGFLVGGFLGLAAALGLWVLAFPYVLGAGTSI
ncbi:hypothetical protein ACFLYD_01780 [Chloroflexota bacterium]